MGISTADKLAKIHQDALLEFDKIATATNEQRQQALESRRFVSIPGAMWEGEWGVQFAKKPKFEVNKIQLALIRIYNEYRNNRFSIDFIPKDGSEADDLAETCDMLHRADEQDSNAQEAYDACFDEGVAGGMGAWRYRTVLEDEYDEENEHQRIVIEPIFDADSTVYFDLGARRMDKSDAKRCWVLHPYTYADYKAEFNDDPTTWPKEVSQSQFDWATPDLVYVAEHYREETKTETYYTFQSITGDKEEYDDDEFEEDETLLERLIATGWKQVGERTKKCRYIHKYLMSGGKILEDCGYIAGKNIPVVVFYGKRWFIDGVERFSGHVQNNKDVARLKNIMLSKMGEIAALSGVQKPIFAPEQISAHMQMWQDDPVKNYPYMLADPLIDPVSGSIAAMGPTSYTKPPDIPPALAALLQLTEQDMQDMLGSPQAADEIMANVSGKAVELTQQRLDMQSYIYMSNMAAARRRGAEIWLGMARETYLEPGRKMKGLNQDGEPKQLTIARPLMRDGVDMMENDLEKASFDIVATVGPASQSKRDATVRSLTSMMQMTSDPETQAVLSAMALINMDGEGLKDARPYFRKKLVGMGVLPPTDEERQEMAQSQQPDPQAQFLQASAEEASARAQKAQADTALALAKTEQTRADTAATLAGIDRDDLSATIAAAKAIESPLKS